MSNLQQIVSVIGLGYIGLPTASLLATKGFKVQGCDVNLHVVDTINRGDIHIVEQDLDILVRSAVHSGQLQASLTPAPADVFIIAVPTPFKANHVPDLAYVESAVRAIAVYIRPHNLIVLESTSPVGTTEKIAAWLSELRPDLSVPSSRKSNLVTNDQIFIAHCPERVLPGQIIRELIDNDRIIGGIDPASAERARHFYKTFVQGEILLTDARTAELAKLTENAFRDVNIAFANELSIICDKLNISVWELIRLANRHPRVNILQPGPGVGGHCIAVDPWFIVDSAPAEAQLIRTAREVNASKPKQVMAKIKEQADRFKSPVIACLGLSFKADIDDLRESPALDIVQHLAQEEIGELLVVEPHITAVPKSLVSFQPRVQLVELESALEQADIVVLLVNHRDFIHIDKQLLAEKIIIDTRGSWQ
jgi:UDP-N-acetyl-D-mannosaminuronic acid dehydrogenase